MFLEHPGMEPIRGLMEDPDVTEIMINGPDVVYVERRGVMKPEEGVRIGGEQEMNLLVLALLKSSGRSVSASSPYVDFRLPDGSRGNIIIPPTLNGVVITIRKFTQSVKAVTDLIRVGTLSKRMAQLLAAAVRCRANIVFAGATGTGKTTTLGVLSKYIPESERVITIEDTAELVLQQKHVVRLECRHSNVEGKGEISTAQLLRNSLRMRPTRLILGEIRGDEAVDMLQAITSGHQGCLAVLHASSPLDAVSRLEMMSLLRGLMLPLWAIHRQIASAIDLFVQHDFVTDGTRKVTYITEVTGLEKDEIVLNDLFKYERRGVDEGGHEKGEWVSKGIEPRFLAKCAKAGFKLPPEVYAAGADA